MIKIKESHKTQDIRLYYKLDPRMNMVIAPTHTQTTQFDQCDIVIMRSSFDLKVGISRSDFSILELNQAWHRRSIPYEYENDSTAVYYSFKVIIEGDTTIHIVKTISVIEIYNYTTRQGYRWRQPTPLSQSFDKIMRAFIDKPSGTHYSITIQELLRRIDEMCELYKDTAFKFAVDPENKISY